MVQKNFILKINSAQSLAIPVRSDKMESVEIHDHKKSSERGQQNTGIAVKRFIDLQQLTNQFQAARVAAGRLLRELQTALEKLADRRRELKSSRMKSCYRFVDTAEAERHR